MQFGLPYGVANRSGQPSLETARAIVARARAAGVDTLDTAIAYGAAEARLGEIGVAGMRVVTKLPPVPADCTDVGRWARNSLAASLARMQITRMHGLLLHRSADLLRPDGAPLYNAMAAMRDEGLVDKIGVSIYAPSELDAIWNQFPATLIQAPFNIVDRRLQESGWMTRLNEHGVEVHTRSAFLQGLLLMRSDERPSRFGRWQALWDAWHAWLTMRGISALRGCLEFVYSHAPVDRVLVGVDSVAQLDDILAIGEPTISTFPDALRNDDVGLIDPSRWNAA